MALRNLLLGLLDVLLDRLGDAHALFFLWQEVVDRGKDDDDHAF